MRLEIDPTLCTACGECVRDCPWTILELPEDGGPPATVPDRERLCIGCQHCLAVCPTGALSLDGFSPMGSRPLKNGLPSPEQMETLIMGRRSVRRFKPDPLDPETLERLLAAAHYAPTGKNTRTTLFTVVDGPESMDRLRLEAMRGLRERIEADDLPPEFEFYKGVHGAWLKGRDVVFRDAPHLLVLSTPKDGPSPRADGYIALNTFELMAGALGVGVLWDGFAKWLLTDIAPRAGDLLNIPGDHVIAYMMLFGRPAVRYHRTVQRPERRVNMVRL